MSSLLGKYRLEQRLGGGGMAEVFLGSTVGAEGFSRRVAIKRVLPGFSENPQFAKMFVDEARISSRLVHPNIVSVLDFDRDPEGRLYLVMELIDGRDLDGLAATGPLPVPVIIFIMSEVLRGLGHAHDLPVAGDMPLNGNTIRSMRGVVHRDVSPHNVLLGWEGAVKVSDFGIAKARSASSATASEFIKGKPAYMSPEQANGENLDGRSDLFAVGVMMWELLVGRRLFVGQDTRTTLAAVLFGQIPRPRSMRSDVPKDVEKVVMKLLERELTARYASAEEAITDLLNCQSAPRDGREVLKKALAERFPQQAPVRHSVARSRGGSPIGGTPQGGYPQQQGTPQGGYPQQPGYPPQNVPVHMQPTAPAPYNQMTIADGAIGRPQPTPHGALPSIGEMRGAQTGTMQPMPDQYVGPAAQPLPRRNPQKKVIVIATLVAAAAVLFAVIAAVTSGGKKATTVAQGSGSESESGSGAASASGAASGAASGSASGAASGSASASGSGSASASGSGAGPAAGSGSVATVADAGIPDAAPTSPQTGSGDTKKDATVVKASEKRMGRLAVKAFPVLTVYVDGKRIRDTPVDIPLTVGSHKLKLVSSEGGSENLTVKIDENKTTEINRN